MPTYYAAGVSARLSTTATCDSLTQRPSAGIGLHVREESERTQGVISQGEILKERPLVPADLDEGGLGFLGKEKEVPFYCVGVNVAEFKDQTSKTGVAAIPKVGITGASQINVKNGARQNDSLNATKDDSLPMNGEATDRGFLPLSTRALSLSVQFDRDQSLRRSLNRKDDLKIEVFYNGRFTQSTFVSSRNEKEKACQRVWFSGERVDRVLEAAWLVSLPQNAHRVYDRAIDENDAVEKRWREFGTAIRAEVASSGRDERGKLSPSSEFLQSLANLDMPEGVKELKNYAGCKFGIIDIVLSLGQGKKHPTSDGYLRQPRRLLDPNFSIKCDAILANNQECVHGGDRACQAISPSGQSTKSALVLKPSDANQDTTAEVAGDSNIKFKAADPKLKEGAERKRFSLGFLQAVRDWTPPPIKDFENYGAGPTPPLLRRSSLTTSSILSRKLLNSTPSKSRQLIPSKLPFKLKVLSLNPDAANMAVLPDKLSPSPKVLATFSMSSPPLFPDHSGKRQLQVNSEIPTWKETKPGESPLLAPLASPITPSLPPKKGTRGPQSVLNNTAVSESPLKVTNNLNQLPDAPREPETALTEPKERSGRNSSQREHMIDGSIQQHRSEDSIGILQMNHETKLLDQASTTYPPGTGRKITDQKGVGIEMSTKSDLWQPIHRIGRNPMRETIKGDAIALKRIAPSAFQTVYGTMDIRSPAELGTVGAPRLRIKLNTQGLPARLGATPIELKSNIGLLKKQLGNHMVAAKNQTNSKEDMTDGPRRKRGKLIGESKSQRKVVNSEPMEAANTHHQDFEPHASNLPSLTLMTTQKGSNVEETSSHPLCIRSPGSARSIVYPYISKKPSTTQPRKTTSEWPIFTTPALIPSIPKISYSQAKLGTSTLTPSGKISEHTRAPNHNSIANGVAKGSNYETPVFEISDLCRDCVISYASRSSHDACPTATTSPGFTSSEMRYHPSASLVPVNSQAAGIQRDQGSAVKPRRVSHNARGSTSADALPVVAVLSNNTDRDTRTTGAYRQIRSERTGEFRESEVLVAVRFVIGVW